MYTAGIYRSSDGRQRWAVLNTTTRTWIFPEKTGRTAAERSARNLNRTAPAPQPTHPQYTPKWRVYYGENRTTIVQARTEAEALAKAAQTFDTTTRTLRAFMIPY